MREEKSVVEQTFRDPRGEVAALAATTTVAAGINTPASTAILAEQEFVGEDGRPFTVAKYKNMAGRAGRVGFNEKGRSIIYAETAIDRERLLRTYVMGRPEPISSSFDLKDLPTWVVRLLAQVKRVRQDAVSKLLANTYGGYLAARRSPSWKSETENRLQQLLVRMTELGLVEQENEYVRLTLLGRACGNAALSFESSLRLVELLRAVGPSELTAEKLLAIVQALSESDGGYTPLMKRGRSEADRPREASAKYGLAIVSLLQRHVDDEFEYLARYKRAAILWDWIHGEPIEQIEQHYSPNPFQGRIGHGDIRRFADSTRFHLRSAHQIMSVLFVDQGPSVGSIETLLKQLEIGIPAGALGLTDLPMPLSRGEYLALFSRGIALVTSVWAALKDQLDGILDKGRIEELRKKQPKDSSQKPGS